MTRWDERQLMRLGVGRYRTEATFDWHAYYKGSGILLTVAKLRLFDNSVPWLGLYQSRFKLLRWLAVLLSFLLLDPDDPRWVFPAMFHDELLRRKASAFRAAVVWFYVGAATGAPRWKRLIIFPFMWLITAIGQYLKRGNDA